MNVRSARRLLQQRGLSKLVALGTLAVLGAAAAGGWWWTHQADAQAATVPAGRGERPGGGGRRFGGGNRVQPVSVAAVTQRDIRVVLTAIGTLTASNTATVRTRVDGELKSIRFSEGQLVRAGAVLAEIEPRNYEIQLQQAQGQLARDAAQLRNARLDLERYKELLAKDSIARQQVESQDALVQQLGGTVQSDQAQVDNAKLLLSYTRVLAPISGKVGFKQVDLGNLVRASDAAGLVSITQTQPIGLVFGVPEGNLPQIAAKLKAGKPLLVEAWDREQRTRLATGKVRSTDNAIDLVTGTIRLKAEFPNADNLLFPNQFVNIRLQVDDEKDALVVPANAIQRGTQGIFVYVVKEDNTVAVRRVRLGATEGDWVAVQGELAVGETVVTDGADRLREGARVDVLTPNGRERNKDRANAPDGDASAPHGAKGEQAARADPAAGKPADKSAAPATARSAAEEARTPRKADGEGRPQGADGERPRWMDRFPPDVVEKLKAMSPEDRRSFLQKAREQRQKEGQ
jgi:multidrug efflux system membrane fusion protein